MNSKVYIDFETRSVLDLKRVGSAVYAADPSTSILCMGAKFSENPAGIFVGFDERASKDSLLYEHALDDNCIFVAHNAAFEQDIWREIMAGRLGYPEIPIERWQCTMAKAASWGLPLNLKDAGKALKLKAQKDTVKQASMMMLSRPKKDGTFWTTDEKPQQFKDMYEYCRDDVETMVELDQTLPDLSDYEQKVWQVNEQINQFGVKMDIPIINKCQKIREQYKAHLIEQFKIVVGSDFRPTQKAKFKQWLHDQGLNIPDTKGSTLKKWRNGASEQIEKAIDLYIASNSTSLAKFDAMLRRSNDGRLQGTAQYHAAGTGRFSGRGVQLQNLFRSIFPMASLVKDIRRYWTDYDWLRTLYGEDADFLKSAIRGVFISDPSYDLIVCDLTSIEAVVLAWLCEQKDLLEDFRNNIDVYLKDGSQIFQRWITKADKKERLVGKVSRLSLGYQGGIAAYLKMGEGYSVDLRPMVFPIWGSAKALEREAARADYRLYVKRQKANNKEYCDSMLGYACSIIKTRWRKANPKIVDYWFKIEQAALMAVETKQTQVCGKIKLFMHKQWLCIKLPSGRSIKYAYPRIDISKRGKKTLSYYRINDKKIWCRTNTYGGKLTENIVQGIARDIFVEALLAISELPDYQILFHVHDEAVVQVKEGTGSVKEIEQIFSRQLDWCINMPISAEAWRGKRYEKK